MPAKRIIPSDSILARWLELGMTQEQMRDRIEEETGVRVGKSTISAALSRAGLTHRVRYDDMIPWPRIKVEHNAHYALTQLRIGARIARGLPVKSGDRHRYENWVKDLDEAGAVVHYDPDTIDGFFYVPRPPGVDGLTLPLAGSRI
jgi:hypothetical protein